MSGAILASGLSLERVNGRERLSGQVSIGGAPPLPVWVEGARLGSQKPAWDPFVPALALLGTARGLDVRIEGDVSPELIRGAGKAAHIWSGWSVQLGRGPLRSPSIVASGAPSRAVRHQGAAVFFSAGVDSFYSLLTNLRRYGAGDVRRPGTLILIHGLDIPLDNTALFDASERAVRQVAGVFGLDVLVVGTNVRALLTGIDWAVFSHEPCMMAAALALAGRIDAVYVPSAYGADELKPNAVHPLVDPLWSTETVDIVHHGLDASRGEKVAAIAASPVAMGHLRVCWENPGNAYNCGRCEKCFRTMLDLWGAGALERSATLPHEFDAAALAALRIPPHLVSFWQTAIDRAAARGLDPATIRQLSNTVRQSRFETTGFARRMNRLAREAAKWGLDPARLKALDARWSGGAGLRALRRFQGVAAEPGTSGRTA
jgi:hypothetical protein